MDIRWTSHLTKEEDKQSLESHIRNSRQAFERLQTLITEKLDAKSKSGEPDYEKPAWAYLQADKLGYMRALNEIKSLITLDKTK